jgi:hypothetical protein
MEELMGIIAIISIFALPMITAMVLIYKKLSSVHKERMGMIQQGIIPPNEPKRKSTPNRYRSLRNGIILIGLGIGFIVGILGTNYLIIGEDNPFLFVIASTVLFLGIGYTVFFLITKDSYGNKGDNVDGSLDEDFE